MSNTKHPTNELLVSLAAFGTGGCGFIDWFQASALGGGFVVARLEIERAALRRLGFYSQIIEDYRIRSGGLVCAVCSQVSPFKNGGKYHGASWATSGSLPASLVMDLVRRLEFQDVAAIP